MSQFLIGLQIAGILMCISCFFLAYRAGEGSMIKHVLMISVCTLISNIGFLLELTSSGADTALIAVKAEYIGSAFLPHFNLLFALAYSRIHVPKKVLSIPFAAGLFTLFCILTYPANTLYYKSVTWVTNGPVPHLVPERGSYYLLYTVLIYCETIGCMMLMLRKLAMTKQKELRRSVKLLLFSSGIPVAAHLLTLSNLTGGYDITPFCSAVAVAILAVALAMRPGFDLLKAAQEQLFKTAELGMVIVDADLRFEEANTQAYAVLPFLRDVLPGKLVTDENFHTAIAQGGMPQVQIGKRFFDVHVSRVMSRDMLTGYAVTYLDVTERKTRAERMRELSRQADSANDAKTAFLSNVSHEIRTPIHAMLGLNEVILRDYSEPRLIEYAKTIKSSASNLLDLINQLLDFSKIESGMMTIENRVYPTKEMVKELTELNKFRAEHKGLHFTVHVDRELPGHLYGDEVRIRQIAENLLSNAIKFTDHGSVDLNIRFEKISSVEGNLRISVSDTGVGIKKTDIARLFDGFVRMDEEHRKYVEGTGLGLNITKSLLNMMEGEISVESEYGSGSTFRVAIPQKLVDSGMLSEETGPEEKKWERDFTAPKARVLVVDDSRINLKVTQALLEPTMVQIDTVTSGSDCLDMICRNHYDVIFLDHRMPYMDGVETFERMKHMSHKSDGAHVIALTANVVDEARAFYLDIGFDDFLPKPVNERTMDEMLKKHLPSDLIEGP